MKWNNSRRIHVYTHLTTPPTPPAFPLCVNPCRKWCSVPWQKDTDDSTTKVRALGCRKKQCIKAAWLLLFLLLRVFLFSPPPSSCLCCMYQLRNYDRASLKLGRRCFFFCFVFFIFLAAFLEPLWTSGEDVFFWYQTICFSSVFWLRFEVFSYLLIMFGSLTTIYRVG